MDETPNLGLPYIMAAQSQKHVTHNEAIRALDAIVQLGVLDRDLTAPPGSPANGARYIVGASPTGAWSGHASSIAAYQDGTWMFHAPSEGWIAWVGDEDAAVVWDGSAWTALTTGGGGGSGSFTTLGVNAIADTTNRLALAAAATLLNHDGAGHQLKINKASTGDTASLLYQDAFSGRAELGLAGDDDFHFKVSADGSTWKEAILINRSTGTVTFPFTTGGRELLTANRSYYVRTDGSDSNNGLANSSGGAKLTLQGAWDAISRLDASIYTITINVGTGTFSTLLNINKAPLGGAGITINGNGAANTILSVANNRAISVNVPVTLTVTNFKIVTTGTGNCTLIFIGSPCLVYIGSGMEFGGHGTGGASWDLDITANGHVFVNSGYTVSGTKVTGHVNTGSGGIFEGYVITVTLSGSPTLGTVANATETGVMRWYQFTFSGAITGSKKYNADTGGIINAFGGSTTFPGGTAGSTATGGQYV